MSPQFKVQQMEGKVWWQEWRMSGHVLSSVRRQKGMTGYRFTTYCIQDSISGDATIPGRWVIPPQLNLSGGAPAT